MKSRQQREPVEKVESSSSKKPRGRPRKQLSDGNELSQGVSGKDIRPLLEKLFAKKRLTHLKDALEQLQEIYEYVSDSIEFGEYGSYRKCSRHEMEQVVVEMFTQ